MPTFFEEFEEGIGIPSDQWSLEQWKQAALGGCKAADLLEAELQRSETLVQQALCLLENEQAKANKLKQLLDDAVRMTQPKRTGRPRKPLTLARLAARKPGRPQKLLVPEQCFTVADDSAELYRRIERIKNERNIKKDTDALQVFHEQVRSVREREKLIAADAKLLSKHRKKIAKS